MMSERPKNLESTIDVPSPLRPDLLRARFEADWRAALEGGAVPQIEPYLGELQDPVRALLRQELEAIDQQYRQQFAAGKATPQDAAVEFVTAEQSGDSVGLTSTVELTG